LIVGGDDRLVFGSGLNRRAFELVRTERRLRLIPGATHLFEEPGALEEVARLRPSCSRSIFRRATMAAVIGTAAQCATTPATRA
jgi:hypothetical protein